MAQEIMVAGAIYEDVPSVRLPDSDGVFHPFTDTSDTTAVAADVAEGKLFHLADGSAVTGTAAGATLVTKSITANGTYSAEDDNADGYSEVTVNVSGGGGGGGVDPKDVNFIDYDGTVLHAYTAAEFAALTAMPDNPTHDGLVAQGWNWTLTDAQGYVADAGTLVIGQMYVTDDGKTRVHVNMPQGRLSPWLSLALNGTAVVDWGDGTTPDTITGTSTGSATNVQHTYASAGRYVIAIEVTTGSAVIRSFDTSATGLLKPQEGDNSYNTSKVYAYAITGVELGDRVTLGKSAFMACASMESVTINQGQPGYDNSMFDSCFSLTGVVLPSHNGSTYSLGGGMFRYCRSMRMASLPKECTNASGTYNFGDCTLLQVPSMPSVFENVVDGFFNNCSQIRRLVLPPRCKAVKAYSISGLSGMTILVIPARVTSIANYAGGSLYGLAEIHFKGTTPPSLSAYSLGSLSTDCKIYVPAGSLAAYTSASNYPDPATYTYVEE